VVKRLLIASEDGYLRVTKGSRFIESAALDDNETGRRWRVYLLGHHDVDDDAIPRVGISGNYQMAVTHASYHAIALRR
jgi:hypothetical protein